MRLDLILQCDLYTALPDVLQSYHSTDCALSLPLLQGLPGLLAAANPLWSQTQQPAHLLPEEAAISVVNRPIVGQDLHSRHLIALRGI